MRPSGFDWGALNDLLAACLDAPRRFHLEDNLRCPSRIAAVIERASQWNAHTRIATRPGSYDPLTCGDPRNGTPGCVANQIVVTDPELRAELTTETEGADTATEQGRQDVGTATQAIAAAALAVPADAMLFRTEWPMGWLDKVGRPSDSRWWRMHGGTFVPTAEDAEAVLQGIVEGRIEDALSRS